MSTVRLLSVAYLGVAECSERARRGNQASNENWITSLVGEQVF